MINSCLPDIDSSTLLGTTLGIKGKLKSKKKVALISGKPSRPGMKDQYNHLGPRISKRLVMM
jgi:hypothetical protein